MLYKTLLQNNDNTVVNISTIDENNFNIPMIDTEEIIKSNSGLNVEKCAAVGYCSGWLAHKAKQKIFKSCKQCLQNLESKNVEELHKYIKIKEYENKTWLCYPSRALFNFFAQIENN